MGWGNESLSLNLGPMIKIFPVPIYGKNPLEMFFSGL